jgi:hypothetical protein
MPSGVPPGQKDLAEAAAIDKLCLERQVIVETDFRNN